MRCTRLMSRENTPRRMVPKPWTVQELTDALLGLESEDTVVEPPKEELILQLEVTMADHLDHPHPPAFSWNAGMVMHILKNDPALRDLEYVQVDNPGTTYLFFLDKQCHHRLSAEGSGDTWCLFARSIL